MTSSAIGFAYASRVTCTDDEIIVILTDGVYLFLSSGFPAWRRQPLRKGLTTS